MVVCLMNFTKIFHVKMI